MKQEKLPRCHETEQNKLLEQRMQKPFKDGDRYFNVSAW